MMKTEKVYDIKERTFEFAVTIVQFVNELPKTTAGYAIGRQLIRSGHQLEQTLKKLLVPEREKSSLTR